MGGFITPPIRLLYVGGSNRTGSTLIDRTLGQVEGFVSVGELINIWARSLTGDRLCGCGSALSHCAFWQRVGELAFGGWEAIDSPSIRVLASRVVRLRHLPLMVFPWLWPPYRRRMMALGEILRRLYAAIRDVAGAEVVVDSSKSPSYALLLHRVGGFDIRVLHLVRDSRGVAHSLVKRRQRHDVPGGSQEMPTVTPAWAAVAWSITNTIFEMLRWTDMPIHRIHYEGFVDDPPGVLKSALARLVDLNQVDFDFIGPGWIRLGVGHSVDGNPIRTKVGAIPIEPNQGRNTALTVRQRTMVTLLSYPLLRYYGYVGARRRRSAAP